MPFEPRTSPFTRGPLFTPTVEALVGSGSFLVGFRQHRRALLQGRAIALNERMVLAATNPAVATTMSMIRATPARWLSTPVCNRLQIKNDMVRTPAGMTRFVAGNSLRPIAKVIAQAAMMARRDNGSTTWNIWPKTP